MAHQVGVIVVTHNSADCIDPLLDSLPEAMLGLTPRVIVVDSGSNDHTVDVVRKRDDCEVLSTSNVGYAAAINLGAAALSDVTAVLVLNPDLVLSRGCVSAMLDELEASGAGIVVPQLLDVDGRRSPSLRRDPTIGRALGLGSLGISALSEIIVDPSAYESPLFVDWATGAIMLVDWTCFSRLGGWDPSFFLYSEETDFCIRARLLGWRTRYTPAAAAVHTGGGSGKSEILHGMQLVNRVRLYGRLHKKPAAYVYLALAVIIEFSWMLRGKSNSATALRMLILPGRRPIELAAGGSLIPQ